MIVFQQDGRGGCTKLALGLGDRLDLLLELLGKGDIVEEDIGIVEFAVPCALEITHGLEELA